MDDLVDAVWKRIWIAAAVILIIAALSVGSVLLGLMLDSLLGRIPGFNKLFGA